MHATCIYIMFIIHDVHYLKLRWLFCVPRSSVYRMSLLLPYYYVFFSAYIYSFSKSRGNRRNCSVPAPMWHTHTLEKDCKKNDASYTLNAWCFPWQLHCMYERLSHNSDEAYILIWAPKNNSVSRRVLFCVCVKTNQSYKLLGTM